MDQWLLTRFDMFVGWNRDRGASNQWNLSRAASDIAIAVNIAGIILLYQMPEAGATDIFMRFILLVSVIGAGMAGRHTVARYERVKDGAMRARVIEQPLRRILIVLTIAMAIANLDQLTLDDIAVDISLLLIVVSVYLKAAAPPPTAKRHEPKVVTA